MSADSHSFAFHHLCRRALARADGAVDEPVHLSRALGAGPVDAAAGFAQGWAELGEHARRGVSDHPAARIAFDRNQRKPKPIPRPNSNSTLTPGTSLTVCALGTPTQVSTSTPSITSLVHRRHWFGLGVGCAGDGESADHCDRDHPSLGPQGQTSVPRSPWRSVLAIVVVRRDEHRRLAGCHTPPLTNTLATANVLTCA
jgi:hypothetical protein